MNRLYTTFLLLLVSTSLVLSIYEEEAGLHDWNIKNIGKVIKGIVIENKYFLSHSTVSINQNGGDSSRTSQIIGLLSSSTGQLIWRQILPIQEKSLQVLNYNQKSKSIKIISNDNIIRSLNLESGSIEWSKMIDEIEQGVVCRELIFVGQQQDSSRVVCGQTVIQMNGANVAWKLNVGRTIIDVSNEIYSYDSTSFYIDTINPSTGVIENKKTIKVINGGGSDEQLTGHVVVGLERVVVLSSNQGKLYVSVGSKSIDSFQSNDIQSLNIELKQQKIESNYFILLVDKQEIVYQVQGSIVSKLLTAENELWITNQLINHPLLIANGKSISIVTEKDGHVQVGQVSPRDGVVMEKLWLVDRHTVIVVASDWSLTSYKVVVGSNLQVLWSREEALSGIIAAELIDIPPTDLSTLKHLEQEFKDNTDESTIQQFFSHLTRRLATQLKSLVGQTDEHEQQQSAVGSIGSTATDKIMIAITRAGMVYGYATGEKKMLWAFPLVQFVHNYNAQSVPILRVVKAQHPGAEIAVIYPVDNSDMPGDSGKALSNSRKHPRARLVTIDPVTGTEKSFKVIYSTPILHATTYNNSLFTVLNYPLDKPPMVQVHPWVQDSRSNWEDLKKLTFFLVDKQQSIVKGFAIESIADGRTGSFKSAETWRINLGSHQTIVAVGSTNEHEITVSPAIVLGNRNLLPKYINRNLISIAAVDTKSSLLSVYLIDSVSGTIIKQFLHSNAGTGLISIVHLENSIIYSYFDNQLNKQLLSSIDIFENLVDWKKKSITAYDENNQDLMIKQKSFVFPYSISTLQLSLSTKGITSKAVLVGLLNGQIIPIEKKWIDSRRPYPSEATPYDQEEGLIPYHSTLNFPHFTYLTFNQSIVSLEKITTQGTSLESTSVMVAFGIDVFCSLISISSPYDILSSSFNHFALVLTSLLLIIMSILTTRMRKEKNLSKKWK